jgi:antitoxin PrlF
MPEATLTSKGQITIPREIRKRLRLEAGDKLAFEIVGDGDEVLLRPAQPSPPSLAGRLSHLAREKPVSLEEMDAAIRERASRGTLRKVRR